MREESLTTYPPNGYDRIAKFNPSQTKIEPGRKLERKLPNLHDVQDQGKPTWSLKAPNDSCNISTCIVTWFWKLLTLIESVGFSLMFLVAFLLQKHSSYLSVYSCSSGILIHSTSAQKSLRKLIISIKHFYCNLPTCYSNFFNNSMQRSVLILIWFNIHQNLNKFRGTPY